ncbi:MAG: rRNA maturation RNase YbeY [Bacteroidales bacterium]|nr:rRNA maturation RNase YbeY [Bacteroidales bacterium]
MIYFHNEEIELPKINKSKIKKWIIKVIDDEGCKTGDINIIFVSDNYLNEINKKYLLKNYLTDIITFNYNVNRLISGDIYISLERVTENAKTFCVEFYNELLRIIIHGILHLLKYDDKNKKSKIEMTEMENLYIEKYYKQ